MQPTPSVFGACLGSASLLSGVTIAAKLETRYRNHQPAMFERLLVALGLTLLFLACGGRAASPANTPSTAPDSSQAQPSAVVAAGRIEDYTSGEPKQFVREKFWLALVGDDLVLALSDRDPHPDFAGDRFRRVWPTGDVVDELTGACL